MKRLQCTLMAKYLGSVQGLPKAMQDKILDVSIVKKESLMHYSPSHGRPFFKATATIPRMISACRTAIEHGIFIDGYSVPEPAYEANIPFSLRFLIDTKMTGCAWNIDVIPQITEGEWMEIPPLRKLSFEGSQEPIFKAIFTLDECAPIAGARVFWFKSEAKMLLKWSELVQSVPAFVILWVDPDILTGYNCINFDLNYLILRSKVLKVDEFRKLGRILATESKIKDSTFSSRAFGTHENKDINVDGRILFDVLELIRREYKLKWHSKYKCFQYVFCVQNRSYTLNFVSFQFLKEQKEDVHYSAIGDLQRGTPETRRRIAVYCLKDAYLPLRLIEKLLLVVNHVEMARVTGTTLEFLLTRGQQIKVTSQLYRKCRELGYVVPTVKRLASGEGAAYEGATVLEPRKGYYANPIATLDFASLYPSIMIAHNLCYSTLVPPHLQNSIDRSALTQSSTQPPNYFVQAHVRKGVLPMIVEELIAARNRAKKQMAIEVDPFVKMVLNGRQMALKITANSVYGYTGATAGGQLPCLEVATSITCFGRDMIFYSKTKVEEIYSMNANFKHNATVIYGDTDSVMVDFGIESIEETMKWGKQAAEVLSKQFLNPIRLEFEKVYCPFILMNKKRYAGLLFTNPNNYDKMDSKGIEVRENATDIRNSFKKNTVRRDFCPLVQQMVDTALKKMLIEKDVEGAKLYTQKKIAELLQNKIDLSLLVITKSLGKSDYDTKLPHVELAKKLKKRDPGNAPCVGDRVSYVITRGTKGQAQYERAEDPLYVLDHNLTIDTQHYVESIKGPIMRIFDGVMKSPETLFSKDLLLEGMPRPHSYGYERYQNFTLLIIFFETIAAGDHTRTVTVLTSSDCALSKYLKKTLQCISCKAIIKSGALCKNCRNTKEVEVILAKTSAMREKEAEYSSLWTECQRCQLSLHQDVICVNRDCPVFYRRAKVKKDIANLQETLGRLTIEW
ncbi:Dna polymerase [Cardiosporidium cionae]|uniref:DNA polymerase n=1 Tax=Cardiosporidium cionae TaxID=476202 RepID=A0ABQ7JDP8_9APIC|nr:Dna polymerase [Cardiosporidium cionae]|eukprot:KAF8822137.1 Dna polymerase [Cardiosporidium cionae]